MKRRDLLKDIASAARAKGVVWELARSTGPHDVYTLDGVKIPVPRHNEINEITAVVIRKQCEPKLGEGWWK